MKTLLLFQNPEVQSGFIKPGFQTSVSFREAESQALHKSIALLTSEPD